MEALLALSGLLAAGAVGAVGVGYFRTRGSSSTSGPPEFPGVTPITTSEGTIYTGPGGASTSPSVAAFGAGSAPTPTGLLPGGLPSGSISGTLAAGVPGKSAPNGISKPGSGPGIEDPFLGPVVRGPNGNDTMLDGESVTLL